MNRMKTSELMKRFAPYYFKYQALLFDLFCAALTTLCGVLPLILRYITNEGMYNLANLTVKTIVTIGLLYFGLRIIDGLANFIWLIQVILWGPESRRMRTDAFCHLQKLSDSFTAIQRWGRLWPHYKRLV